MKGKNIKWGYPQFGNLENLHFKIALRRDI